MFCLLTFQIGFFKRRTRDDLQKLKRRTQCPDIVQTAAAVEVIEPSPPSTPTSSL